MIIWYWWKSWVLRWGVNRQLPEWISGPWFTEKKCVHVAKRPRGLDGTPIVFAHTNPMFYTHEYYIEFTYGSIKKYSEDMIYQ